MASATATVVLQTYVKERGLLQLRHSVLPSSPSPSSCYNLLRLESAMGGGRERIL